MLHNNTLTGTARP